MEKRVYLQPVTKVLSMVYGDVCETGIQESVQEYTEEMYGPPGIFDDAPLY